MSITTIEMIVVTAIIAISSVGREYPAFREVERDAKGRMLPPYKMGVLTPKRIGL